MDMWKKSRILHVFIVFLIIAFSGLCAHGNDGVRGLASFHGNSYVSLPVNDASSSTHVTIQFKTFDEDGILLLATGSRDYCIVTLKGGVISVGLELGSGEATLSSTPGRRYNDNEWHEVRIVRVHNQLELAVDDRSTKVTTPGGFFELNIDGYIYVGGAGSGFDRLFFFGNYGKFRGCVRVARFNNFNILQEGMVHDVTLGATCSSDLEASSEEVVYFSPDSDVYAAMHTKSGRPTEGQFSVTFHLRTKSKRAVLLAYTGSTFSNFLFVELVKGKIRIKLGVEGNADLTTLTVGSRRVDDGDWHSVSVSVSGRVLEIKVDNDYSARETLKTRFVALQFSQSSLPLFVGGFDDQMISVVRNWNNQGRLEAAGQRIAPSFAGCLHSININNVRYGFREISHSNGIKPGCGELTKDCINSNCPSEETGCADGEEGCDDGEANDDDDVENVDNDEPEISIEVPQNTDEISVHDVIKISDLMVGRGKRSTITDSHIRVNLGNIHIPDADIIFKVTNTPENGEVIVNVRGRASDQRFSLDDLRNYHVTYRHDGSEANADSVGLEMEFDTRRTIPDRLNRKYAFTLMIQVSESSGKLVLKVAEVLELLSNSNVRIGTDIFNITGSNDGPSNIKYFITNRSHGRELGFFENSEKRGEPAREFTQDDLMRGKIKFTHRGPHNQEFLIRVQDSTGGVDEKVLRVSAVSMDIVLVKMSDLYISRGLNKIITPEDLHFTTNTSSSRLEPKYFITEPPLEGMLQIQQSDGNWSKASSFTQKQIERGKVRYSHYGDSLSRRDRFSFRVQVKTIRSAEHTVNIEVSDSIVNLVRSVGLILRGTREGVISSNTLLANSSSAQHGPKDIYYHLISVPREGNLILLERDINGNMKRTKLQVGSNFTQADVGENKLIYKLDKMLTSEIIDNFEFRLLVPGVESVVALFVIRYEPVLGDRSFINNGITAVPEGGSKIITENDLASEKQGVRDFRYTIIEYCNHGAIKQLDPASRQIINHNISSFTNEDIKQGKIFYFHDDSESSADSFSFTSTPIIDLSHLSSREGVQEITELSGTFDIEINLLNDNSPKSFFSGPLRMVQGQGRVIRKQDVWFSDPDVNYDSRNLRYNWDYVPNGHFTLIGNPSLPISTCTQGDVEDGRLYFTHTGLAKGDMTLRVTDGQHLTSILFTIEASDAFIRVPDIILINITNGNSITLTLEHFKIETNLDMRDENVKFFITTAPTKGILRHDKDQSNWNHYTLQNIRAGNVVYEYKEDNKEALDGFSYLVRIQSAQASGSIRLNISMEIAKVPLRVIHNRVAMVEESDHSPTITITSDLLSISHPVIQPDAIQFLITTQPRYGVVRLIGQDDETTTFTQDLINRGLLEYALTHQTNKMESDTFRFDVRAGESRLSGLEFVVEIVPNVLPLQTGVLTVSENGRASLDASTIRLSTRYPQQQQASGPQVELIIMRGPRHGRLERRGSPGVQAAQFSTAEVGRRDVLYLHDGTESTEDDFIIMASSGKKKKSELKVVKVIVIPTNDQLPRIVNNKKFIVWKDAITPITQEELLAVDNDSLAEDITFNIGSIRGGFVALMTDVTKGITSFTQEQINQNQVTFVLHASQNEGEFEFDISDGASTSPVLTFTVEGRRLELSVDTPEPLKAFPRVRQPITTRYLNASTNQDPPGIARPIVYTVQRMQRKHQYGRLVMYDDSGFVETQTFSQEDIDAGIVSYECTSYLGGSWNVDDMFIFDVSTAYAKPVSGKTFHILISYGNINDENIDELIMNQAPSVEEGGSVVITDKELDSTKLKRILQDGGKMSDVYFVIAETPSNGTLEVRGKLAHSGTRISQSDINNRVVVYRHDNSEGLVDFFTYRVEIDFIELNKPNDKQQTRALTYTDQIFNITIRPLNDQSFRFAVDSPGITLRQGSREIITNEMLSVLDADTPPDGIHYEISYPSAYGFIRHRDRMEPVESFTQQDVNEGKLEFVHDGSPHSPASFHFLVSDGSHRSLYKTFDVIVNPIILEVPMISNVPLLQGHKSVAISSKNIKLGNNTNAPLQDISYNITRRPTIGELYIDSNVIHGFSQKDLDEGRIYYVLTDLNGGWDTFEMEVYCEYAVVHFKMVNVSVLPNLKKSGKPFYVNPSNKNDSCCIITLDDLNANDLALVTDSMPIYIVTEPPRHGTLSKLPSHPARREVKKPREKDLHFSKKKAHPEGGYFNFTHDDVINKRIQYRPSESSVSSRTSDRFGFLLTAANSPSAYEYLDIEILPPAASHEAPKIPGEENSETSTGGDLSAKPVNTEHMKARQNYVTIVLIVVFIVVLIIVAFITCKCYRLRKAKRKRAMESTLKEDSRSPLSVDISSQSVVEHGKQGNDNQGNGGRAINVPISKSTSPTGGLVPEINVMPDTPPRIRSVAPSSEGSDNSDRDFSTADRGRGIRSRSTDRDDDRRTSSLESAGFGSRKDQVMFDWENVDPELLQHCRKTTPILHKNQYWV